MIKRKKFEVAEDNASIENGATSEKKVKNYRSTEQRVSDLSKQCTTVSGYPDVRAAGLGRDFRRIADELETLQVKLMLGNNEASAQTSSPGS